MLTIFVVKKSRLTFTVQRYNLFSKHQNLYSLFLKFISNFAFGAFGDYHKSAFVEGEVDDLHCIKVGNNLFSGVA